MCYNASISLTIRTCCIFLFLLPGLALPLQAQLSLSVQSGTELGWWVYNKGWTDTLPTVHQGYDRTHLSFVAPVGLQLQYQHQRWEYGLGLQFRVLFDDVLIGSDHRRGGRNQYNLSRNGSDVGFVLWQGHLAWLALEKGRYQLWPQVQLGGFRPIATHPREQFFQYFVLYSLGLEQRVRMGDNWALQLSPRYVEQTIFTGPGAYEGETHKIYTIGLILGICRFL